jgi:HlyD family secretion protein
MNQSELAYARYAFERDQRLYAQDVLPRDQYQDKKKILEVREAMLSQAVAEKAARVARGAIEAEAELARREKELADARGTLILLEAGARPEEIEAERAKVARLAEELAYLRLQRERLPVVSPVTGAIITPRLKEKVGQYLKEGDTICVVDQTRELEVEVNLDEQELERVQVGQRVELKARAFPFRTFEGQVSRIAPAARREQQADPGKAAPPPPSSSSSSRTDQPGTVTVYVLVEDAEELRPGMTGNARIHCGRRRLGVIAVERALRLLKTDYWW